jgi:dUTP pyrophosphatase
MDSPSRDRSNEFHDLPRDARDGKAAATDAPGFHKHNSSRHARGVEETVVFIRVGPHGKLPLYATPGSAGCDLIAAEPIVLWPGASCLARLDFIFALEPGIEAQVRPRSGLSLRTTLRVPNSPGTIDSDFREPVCVLLENTFSMADLPMLLLENPSLAQTLARPDRQTTVRAMVQDHNVANRDIVEALDGLPDLADQVIYLDDRKQPFGTLYFEPGDRIAQVVFSRYVRARFVPHEQPESVGENRGGGFGSTGMRKGENES